MSLALPSVAAIPPRGAELDDAYRHCWRIATAHYENFSVGSWLLPKSLRRHMAALYAFARTADDIADEGDASAADRLVRLRACGEALDDCYRGRARDPIFVALAHTTAEFDLPIDLFRRLLHAFEADVQFAPFETFEHLRDYCRCSADPVGQLVLHLFGYRDAQRQRLADRICTGLQLANFWQDVAVDVRKGRVYFPLEDLRRFGCTAGQIGRGEFTDNFRRLMQFEVDRARGLLTSGLQLGSLVERRLAREVQLFAGGGLAILRAIEGLGYDVLRTRPTLLKRTKIRLIAGALLNPAVPNRGSVSARAPGPK
ncbi:MAG TPA: squalene synthase HpnC [Candidatus Kryptonia bacterium]|nr:squalene synthase HpnC [Candidatus Kryptonia bacterium]